jgi:hypothetical protein
MFPSFSNQADEKNENEECNFTWRIRPSIKIGIALADKREDVAEIGFPGPNGPGCETTDVIRPDHRSDKRNSGKRRPARSEHGLLPSRQSQLSWGRLAAGERRVTNHEALN